MGCLAPIENLDRGQLSLAAQSAGTPDKSANMGKSMGLGSGDILYGRNGTVYLSGSNLLLYSLLIIWKRLLIKRSSLRERCLDDDIGIVRESADSALSLSDRPGSPVVTASAFLRYQME